MASCCHSRRNSGSVNYHGVSKPDWHSLTCKVKFQFTTGIGFPPADRVRRTTVRGHPHLREHLGMAWRPTTPFRSLRWSLPDACVTLAR